MKTSTGVLMVLASAAGAAAGVWLARKRGPALRLLAAGVGFAAPWGIRAAFASEPRCTILFVTDTHGSALANAPLVEALLGETGVDRVIHGGDMVDDAGFWPVWWDRPFAEVMSRWPVDAVSGNHDHHDAETYAGFVERFGEEPRSVSCGNVEFLLVPWRGDRSSARWLLERVRDSAARWKVLVTHKPPWGVDGTGADVRRLYAESLPHIDLVLAGHQHVSQDSVHDVDGHLVRQIIDVSGPKKYRCPASAPGCIQDETGYWRIAFGDSIEATRKVIRPASRVP